MVITIGYEIRNGIKEILVKGNVIFTKILNFIYIFDSNNDYNFNNIIILEYIRFRKICIRRSNSHKCFYFYNYMLLFK